MLEVKNLRKIYKTKKGADVKALDGISLQFPETGMVFLLGRSGSGKSTLLNVCGGLDSPTEGEIIVKGRSSKSFSQSDFDSYRNTFIGFIFQEYNILNEFSVEDNIALALELQGKSKDKAAIAALLEDVDLTGFAKRKPNTLSGGQRQRIAIARALVKSPEIIMADEPTGALDSNTGKQVFDTLKKLSKDKLVIVVSHDRDFAQQYGDRIIELKDGKILSDVSKAELKQQALSENVNTIGDVLCIKNGSSLTEQDFDKIKLFLKNSKEDVIIANNEKDVENFKKVSRINDSGEKEVFLDTDVSKNIIKEYSKEDSRFIRSRLPIRHAVRIGVSSLRNKPFRLFLTIVLCTVAFVLFGLLSTLNFYDSYATFKQTMADSSSPVIQIKKEYLGNITWYMNGQKDHTYEMRNQARFTKEDIEKYKAELTSDAFGALSSNATFNIRQIESDYWMNNIVGFAVLPENHYLKNSISGTYPQKKDEIAISSYTADMFVSCKIYDSEGSLIQPISSNDIIGKKIILNGTTYKITAIIDTGLIPEQFSSLKETNNANNTLTREFDSYMSDNMHLLTFVTEDALSEIIKNEYVYREKLSNHTYATVVNDPAKVTTFPEWSNATYIPESEISKGASIVSVSGKTETSSGEVILSSNLFASIIRDSFYALADEANMNGNYTLADKYYKYAENTSVLESAMRYVYDEETQKTEEIPVNAAELEKVLKELIEVVKTENIPLNIGLKLFNMGSQTNFGDTYTYNVSAVYVEDNPHSGMTTCVAVCDTDFNSLWDVQKSTVDNYAVFETTYQEKENANYSTIYLPFTYSEETVDSYWQLYTNEKWDENSSMVSLSGNFIYTLKNIDSMVKQMSKIFLYVGIVFAVFAALLFSNFISASISQKKREIGILRAVGARSTDVFKIFFSESFVIAAICIALSTAASVVLCSFLNTQLASGIGASLFVFGVFSFAILVTVALLTAIISTFLPVYNAAKKKPVDSIRSL